MFSHILGSKAPRLIVVAWEDHTFITRPCQVLDTSFHVGLLALEIYSIFLEGIPFLRTRKESPPEAEDLCPLFQSLCQFPFPYKGVPKVLVFLALQFLTTDSSIPTSEQSADHVLTWMTPEILSHNYWLTQGQRSSGFWLAYDLYLSPLLFSRWPCCTAACLFQFFLLLPPRSFL